MLQPYPPWRLDPSTLMQSATYISTSSGRIALPCFLPRLFERVLQHDAIVGLPSSLLPCLKPAAPCDQAPDERD